MKRTIISMICVILVCAMIAPAVFADALPLDYSKYAASAAVGIKFSRKFAIDTPEGWTGFEAALDEEKTNALAYGLDFFFSGNGVMVFGEPTRPGVAILALTLTADGKEPESTEIQIIIDPVKVNAKDELNAAVGDKINTEFVYEDYGIYLLYDWGINMQKSKITSDDLGLKFTLTESKLLVEGKATKAGKADAHIVFDIAKGECTLDITVNVGEKAPVTPTDPTQPTEPVTPAEPTQPTEPAFEFTFTDVKKSDWFYDDVYKAVEMGLVNGKSKTEYKPNDNMTYAEAIKLAACMNQKYTTGKVTLENGVKNWYDTYVDYAKANGIPADFADMNAKITRADFAHIFANALPEGCYAAINEITAVPDVDAGDDYAGEILALYNAGILTGSDAKGTFNADSFIKRSEVAAIVTRMMNDTTRKTFEL